MNHRRVTPGRCLVANIGAAVLYAFVVTYATVVHGPLLPPHLAGMVRDLIIGGLIVTTMEVLADRRERRLRDERLQQSPTVELPQRAVGVVPRAKPPDALGLDSEIIELGRRITRRMNGEV